MSPDSASNKPSIKRTVVDFPRSIMANDGQPLSFVSRETKRRLKVFFRLLDRTYT